jgi:hypothetical protein
MPAAFGPELAPPPQPPSAVRAPPCAPNPICCPPTFRPQPPGVLYFSVAISGYAAMGSAAGPNIIISLSNGPLWLRNLARAMVVVHVLAAYQVRTQGLTGVHAGAGAGPGGSQRLGLPGAGRGAQCAVAERTLCRAGGMGRARLARLLCTSSPALQPPCAGAAPHPRAHPAPPCPAPCRLPPRHPQVYTHPVFDWIESAAGRVKGLGSVFSYGSWPSRLILRTGYVGIITLVAILVPFFGDLMALIGAIAVTPTTYLLPPLLWLMLMRPRRWSAEWMVNVGLVGLTGVIGAMGTISSVWLLITHAKEYHMLAV